MRPVRPESGARSLGRVSKKVGALQRRDSGATNGWVLFEEPFDGDWEYTGVPDVFPAWKKNPNPGKHPFLRGSWDGTSGTSPATLPAEAGAPFDGLARYVTVYRVGAVITISVTEIDEDGVITVYKFSGASQEDIDAVSDDLAAHLADTSGAHAATAISIVDSGGNYAGTNVETVLAEVAGLITGLASDIAANASAITAHIDDDDGAHTAAAIDVTDPGNHFDGLEVETVLEELWNMIDAIDTGGGGGSDVLIETVLAKDMVASTTGGASGPNHTELTTNKQNIVTMDFADGSDLKAEFSLALPASYGGESFTFRVRWLAAGTATDGVAFGIEARAVGNNEAIDGAWGTQVLIGDAHTATANNELHTDESAAVTPSNTPAAGDTVYFRLQRKASSTSPSDSLAQTVKVLGVDIDFTGSGVAGAPSFVAAGAGNATAAAPGDLPLAYPSGLADQDLLLAHVCAGSGTVDAVPSGWTLLFGPDASSVTKTWVYYKWSDGTETGSQTWSLDSSSAAFWGRMYAFRGVDSSIYESSGSNADINTSITHAAVTTTGINRTAVCLVTVNDDNTMADMTGETGGDWTRPVSDYLHTTSLDGALGIQTADMPSAGTLSGGGITMAASDRWITRSFALLPVGA